jgi:hypothetical protein
MAEYAVLAELDGDLAIPFERALRNNSDGEGLWLKPSP